MVRTLEQNIDYAYGLVEQLRAMASYNTPTGDRDIVDELGHILSLIMLDVVGTASDGEAELLSGK